MTLEELSNIKDSFLKEEKRKALSIELDICPICDSPLIREDWEILDKPKRIFFFFKEKEIYWDYRKVCSKNKAHYEQKYNYDDYY